MANTKVKAEQLEAAQTNITSVGTLTGLTGGTGDLIWDTSTFVVDSSANKVGIGTTAPVYDLHIHKASSSSQSRIQLTTSESGATASDGYAIAMETDGRAYNWLYENAYMVFATNNTERLRIDSAGNVGIGTNNPSKKLHVNMGGTLVTGQTYDAMIIQNSDAVQLRIVDAGDGGGNGGHGGIGNDNGNINIASAGVMTFSTALTANEALYGGGAGTGGDERMRIASDGKVGIGTTAPASLLDLRTTTAGSLTSGSTRLGSVITLHHEAQWENGYTGGDFLGGIEWSSGDASTGEGTRAAIRTDVSTYYNTNSMRFYVAGSNSTTLTERMQIRYDGNVGIGSTNPVHTLDIDDGATTAEVRVRGGGTDYINAGIVLQATNGTHDRGLGVFMHDEGGDVEWYAGTPYSAADQYIVARGGTASHSTSVAQRGSALFRIGSNGLWEFNTYNPQASIRTYVYEATVPGNTVKDLFYNTGAYDDLHFIIWVECHHSSRTYFCGTGNIGYYGLNFSGSGTGLSNGGLQIATVNTGRKMLQFNNSNSLNSSTFIAAMIFGNNGVTVSNGSISNTTI